MGSLAAVVSELFPAAVDAVTPAVIAHTWRCCVSRSSCSADSPVSLAFSSTSWDMSSNLRLLILTMVLVGVFDVFVCLVILKSGKALGSEEERNKAGK